MSIWAVSCKKPLIANKSKQSPGKICHNNPIRNILSYRQSSDKSMGGSRMGGPHPVKSQVAIYFLRNKCTGRDRNLPLVEGNLLRRFYQVIQGVQKAFTI